MDDPLYKKLFYISFQRLFYLIGFIDAVRNVRNFLGRKEKETDFFIFCLNKSVQIEILYQLTIFHCLFRSDNLFILKYSPDMETLIIMIWIKVSPHLFRYLP